MKTNKFLIFLIISILSYTSCSKNDPAAPAVINEEELITTMTITLSDPVNSTTVTLQTKDLDADGPNPPVITVSGKLKAGVTYNGSIVLLNETVSPAENVTEEVEKEDVEHQFFYTIGSGLKVTTEYSNFDTNKNNLGTKFKLNAVSASSGKLTFTLRHQPTKPNTGLSDAGGETDIESTFDITVE